MKKFLLLDKNQQKRVDKFTDGDAPVSSLQSPEELHYAAAGWNWDNGVKKLQKLIARPDCSLATMIMIYWNGEPDEMFEYKNAKEAEEDLYMGDVFELLIDIEKRVLKGNIPTFGIGFNPKDNENGVDLTQDWNHPSLKHRVPPKMLKKVEGLRIDSDSYRTE
jgi:hypothetical protein